MSLETNGRVYLPTSKTCFICGEENPAGLQARFYIEDNIVKADLNAQEHHCGYPNVLHGGVVAAILDETMGWAATYVIERMCYTADLSIRYLKPVPCDRTTTVATKVLRASKRLAEVEGEIRDEAGEVYVRGRGKFFPLSIERTLEVDDHLLYRGGEARLFDELRANFEKRD